MARAADLILFCCSNQPSDRLLSSDGYKAIQSILPLGLACAIVLAVPSKSRAQKHQHLRPQERLASIKLIKTSLSQFLSDDLSVMLVDTLGDAIQVVQRLTKLAYKPKIWKLQRPYIVSESATIYSQKDISLIFDSCIVKVDGFLRSQGISASKAIHIPGAGDFLLYKITGPRDLQSIDIPKVKNNSLSNNDGTMDGFLLDLSTNRNRESFSKKNTLSYFKNTTLWERKTQKEKNSRISGRKYVSMSNIVSESNLSVKFHDIGCKFDFFNSGMQKSLEKTNFDFSHVDIPVYITAFFRFLRYRGLRSLRIFSWDFIKSLPSQYLKLFLISFEQFQLITCILIRCLKMQLKSYNQRHIVMF
jgi:hypothetical protein